MAKGILIAAYIEGIRSRKDKTVAITVGTQELSPEKAGEIFHMNGKLITAYLSNTEVTKDDQDVVDAIELDLPGKSPSQRLRSVLFLMWREKNEGFTDQNLHYIHHMEKIIEHYKTKLPAK